MVDGEIRGKPTIWPPKSEFFQKADPAIRETRESTDAITQRIQVQDKVLSEPIITVPDEDIPGATRLPMHMVPEPLPVYVESQKLVDAKISEVRGRLAELLGPDQEEKPNTKLSTIHEEMSLSTVEEFVSLIRNMGIELGFGSAKSGLWQHVDWQMIKKGAVTLLNEPSYITKVVDKKHPDVSFNFCFSDDGKTALARVINERKFSSKENCIEWAQIKRDKQGVSVEAHIHNGDTQTNGVYSWIKSENGSWGVYIDNDPKINEEIENAAAEQLTAMDKALDPTIGDNQRLIFKMMEEGRMSKMPSCAKKIANLAHIHENSKNDFASALFREMMSQNQKKGSNSLYAMIRNFVGRQATNPSTS